MEIFKNKDSFKKEYLKKLEDIYKVDAKGATLRQKYYTLTTILNENFRSNYYQTSNNMGKDKCAIYFSMEFLIGRLITNNMRNSGIYETLKKGLNELEIDINEIEEFESDAGLGNGGLGRLAACFLDSAASLSLPLIGNSIRYKKGFFTQKIVNDKQVEEPDNWLDHPFSWEEKSKDFFDIEFFGRVENNILKDSIKVKAVGYDVKIIGNNEKIENNLRLWASEISENEKNINDDYLKMVEDISNSLYPDDSTTSGKILRLQQQYFFSAAGIRWAIKSLKAKNGDIKKLADYFVFQINDTHPTLIILELMRILIDEEKIAFNDAFNLTRSVCAFTNHTILAEALEKWDVTLFKQLLPRIYQILEIMNDNFKQEINNDKRFNKEEVEKMLLISGNKIRMANIAIVGSFSVNGVAELHSEILKNIVMKSFNTLYPDKFNNKTNGITPRRWLFHINNELVALIDSKIGTKWKNDLSLLKDFEKFKDDQNTQEEFLKVKQMKKIQLAKKIKKLEKIEISENSIFDIQVKRLHEYKRQLLNIMHIIYVYQRLKSDKEFKNNYYPHTFIFGAKSAPSYHMAKSIIELINKTARLINLDSETSTHLKVVFVENYNVTYAEAIMPAADLSEQISTASKEASGTGNMKFMINGALTIGTMDGANVEICKFAGIENEFIFGLSASQVNEIYEKKNYNPLETFKNDERLINIFNFIKGLDENENYFKNIFDNLLYNDYFLVLKDFNEYVIAHEKANTEYKNKLLWAKKAIINIANANYFSSDRTINDYNRDIWKLEKINK